MTNRNDDEATEATGRSEGPESGSIAYGAPAEPGEGPARGDGIPCPNCGATIGKDELRCASCGSPVQGLG